MTKLKMMMKIKSFLNNLGKSSKKERERNEYIDQRKLYLQDKKDSIKVFDNTLITLSSGLLGAVLVLIPSIIKDFKESFEKILVIYLGIFLLVIFIGLISILVSYKNTYLNSSDAVKREDLIYRIKKLKRSLLKIGELKKTEQQKKDIQKRMDSRNKLIELCNIVSLDAFIIALWAILLFYFMLLYINYVK